MHTFPGNAIVRGSRGKRNIVSVDRVHAINGLEMRIFSISVVIHRGAIFGVSGSEACCVPGCEEEYGEHE